MSLQEAYFYTSTAAPSPHHFTAPAPGMRVGEGARRADVARGVALDTPRRAALDGAAGWWRVVVVCNWEEGALGDWEVAQVMLRRQLTNRGVTPGDPALGRAIRWVGCP